MESAPKDSEAAVVTEYNQETIVNKASLACICPPPLRYRFEDDNVSTKYLLSNTASIAIIKNNFNRKNHQSDEFEWPLKCYDDAWKILLKSELNFLPEMSTIYNNIGGIQCSKKYCTVAVERRQSGND